jgi:hypothetical protein
MFVQFFVSGLDLEFLVVGVVHVVVTKVIRYNFFLLVVEVVGVHNFHYLKSWSYLSWS